MGLGLTIVHSVVRCHGGQISIESQEDLGTTVRIWIPLFSGVPTEIREPGAEGGIEAEREPGRRGSWCFWWTTTRWCLKSPNTACKNLSLRFSRLLGGLLH